MLTALIQTIYDNFVNLAEIALGFLPLSPFRAMHESGVLQGNRFTVILSLFIPFGPILATLQTWLAAIILWYLAKKGLRWAKFIR